MPQTHEYQMPQSHQMTILIRHMYNIYYLGRNQIQTEGMQQTIPIKFCACAAATAIVIEVFVFISATQIAWSMKMRKQHGLWVGNCVCVSQY